MKVLLIGKGGREHALAWRLSTSPSVEHVYVVPGNGGTLLLTNVSNVDAVAANDYTGLVSFARKNDIGLVVAGPDDIVVGGIEGYFRDTGIPCFAPSKEAAELEGSKSYAKDFMKRHMIPTAQYASFQSFDDAQAYLNTIDDRVVIKADGLASGKGVILPKSMDEGIHALKDMMLDARFGSAGQSVVIEEFLVGEEISLHTFSDGVTHVTLPPGQDHKRIFEGGPNTGGMGVYAPVPFVTRDQMADIEQRIIKPTLDALRSEGRTFRGLLFTGVMLTPSGPKVLEYNVRFGDPETQTMSMLIANEDFADLLLACAQERLSQVPVQIRPGYACNVVISSAGYPWSSSSGDLITLSEPNVGAARVFHAGTKRMEAGDLVTAGGRVFSVAAIGATLEEAVAAAYEAVGGIHFRGMYYRPDIASSAMNR